MVMTSTENIEQLPGSTKSSLAIETNSEEIAKIEQLVSEGYRLYLSKEYEDAADKLGQANELGVEIYGQFAPECFKPHFYYGMTLLEIARNEATILKAPGADEGNEEAEQEDENEEEQANGNAEEENGENANENGQNVAENGASTDEVPTKANTQTENVANTENGSNGNANNQENGASTQETEIDQQKPIVGVDETLKTENGDEAEEIEEDPGTETLAWESLEVARKICEKLENNSQEWLEKKAEVLVALSDCMIIAEQYDTALNDLQSALEIQKKLYAPHDRRIAETYYHIGRCQRNSNEFKDAAASFEEAGNELQNIIDAIQAKSANSEQLADAKDLEEVESLKIIIKEIQESAVDARESEEARCKQLEEQRAIVESVFTQILSQDTVTNDITQLVRKSVKRPTSGAETTTVSAAGDASNGSTDAVFDDAKVAAPPIEPESKKVKLGEDEA